MGKIRSGGEKMNIFTKEPVSKLKSGEDVCVSQLAQEYNEYMERQYNQEELRINTAGIELFYQYCNDINPRMQITELEEEVFWQFFLYWLPKEGKRISNQITYEIMHVLHRFCKYASNQYTINWIELYSPVYKDLMDELPRIMEVKKAFSKYLGNPIVDWEPLIIDLERYKKHKAKTLVKESRDIFEQGLFEVIEIAPNNAVILKKKQGYGLYAKVMLDDTLIQYLRNHDILHVRMRRKLFFTCWDIEEVKSCYLPKAQKYMK